MISRRDSERSGGTVVADAPAWRACNSTFLAVVSTISMNTLLFAGCGTELKRIKIQNSTNHNVEKLYVYKAGSSDKGKNIGPLGVNQSASIAMPNGRIVVYGVTETVYLDAHTPDVATSEQILDLTAPLKIILYDDNSVAPAETTRPNVIGMSFGWGEANRTIDAAEMPKRH